MKFDTDVKVVQALKADAWGVAANTSSAIDGTGFDTARVILNAGTAGGELNVKVQSATTSGGSYADISGAAFAEVTSTNDDAVYVGIVHLNELAAGPFLKVVGTVTTGACDFGVIVELFNSRESNQNTTTLAFNT